MDQIIIEDLEVHYRVGVPDEERIHPQKLLLCVQIDHEFDTAQASDDLSHTIDYGKLTSDLTHFGEGRDWKLIERLANDIAQWILRDFGASRVQVEVRKFIIPNAKFVGVRVSRSAPSSKAV